MKAHVTLALLLFLLAFVEPNTVSAQPDFSGAFRKHGVILFRDVKLSNTYYYLPGDLEIAKAPDGRPDLNFIMMRYTGSAVYDESEGMRYRNIFSMRLVMKNVIDDSLRLAKAELDTRSMSLMLKPLPISAIDAMLVFIPVGGNDSTSIVRRGNLSAEGNSGYSSFGSYWQERFFTIYLDNHSANLLLEAFKKDLTAISFMYAFHSKGKSTKTIPHFSGHHKLARTFREQFKDDESDTRDTLRECIIKSDAFAINIDTLRYPNLIRQIDINNGVPPGYAVLNVRNYDFANGLRTDLYEKTVELQATGAGGGKVEAHVTFRSSDPDITSTNFKFRYAVRLDKPYRYRVRELFNDGRELVTEWKDVSMWSALLDVTTRKINH